MATKEDALHGKLSALVKEMKEAGTYKRERVITSPQSAEITVEESEAPVLNFCAYV
jgi:glycine C-acetyltransferase